MPPERPKHRGNVKDLAAIFGLILVTVAAFWRTLPSYFLSDDFVLLKHAKALHGAFRPLFTNGGGDGFFRPIGYVSLVLTSTWAGANPTLWHATALVLHIVNVLLVFTLAFVIGRSRFASFFAAALFAIHGTRPEVAVWIAGRFDLLSTFFVLCGLLFFIGSQSQAAPVGHFYAAASMVCMVLAILNKETAYLFPALLVLVLVDQQNVSRRKMASLIPFFVAAAALFLYRLWIFSGVGGYNDPLTGKSLALSIRLLPALKALLLRTWAILFFPINWSREPNKLLVLTMMAYILALVWLTTARMNRMRLVFPLAFVFVTAVPALPLLLIGQDLNKSRLLYLPSVGFSILLATLLDAVRCKVRGIIPDVILAFHVAVLQHNRKTYRRQVQQS